MKKLIPFLLLLAFCFGCSEKPTVSTAQANRQAKDPKVAAIEANIAKTTPEGKEMIEKLKAMKPEVNEQVAGKSLGEIVADYGNKGDYSITPIGWETSQKKNGNWKLLFHYQDYSKQVSTAEWEYNPTTKKLYPFEFANAKGFWTPPQPSAAKMVK